MEAARLMCSCCELPHLFPDIHLPRDKGKTAWKWWSSEYVMNVLSVWNKKVQRVFRGPRLLAIDWNWQPGVQCEGRCSFFRMRGWLGQPCSPLLLFIIWFRDNSVKMANNGTCLDLIIRTSEWKNLWSYSWMRAFSSSSLLLYLSPVG